VQDVKSQLKLETRVNVQCTMCNQKSWGRIYEKNCNFNRMKRRISWNLIFFFEELQIENSRNYKFRVDFDLKKNGKFLREREWVFVQILY